MHFFLTDGCRFSTEEIPVLRISILPLNVSQLGGFLPLPLPPNVEANFRTKRIFSDRLFCGVERVGTVAFLAVYHDAHLFTCKVLTYAIF